MNYLELCQELRREAQIPGSGPTSVTGQTGENQNLVSWINRAWQEIQLLRTNWMWMNGEFSLVTVADKFSYTPAEAGIATRFASWDIRSMRVYETASGSNTSTELPFLDYVMYRDYYLTNTQAPGRPIIHSVAPNLNLLLGPKPNEAGYTVVGEYRKTTQALAANTDIPEMPADYHMMIVYKALMKYARAEAAGEIYADAKAEYDAFKRRLELNQLPPVSLAEPLV